MTLEHHKVTPRDIKGNNFLISNEGQVSLIDFDNARFNEKPMLVHFLRVLWDMFNEKCITSADTKKLIGALTADECEQYFGEIGSIYAEPILFQRVKSFRELVASVKNK